MRIGELATRVGVSTDTIRFYEKSGLLPRPARRRDNDYRAYDERDEDHLRLLVELRRLDLPLDDAARVASWCHSGHCGETTAALPSLIADRRADIAERIASLLALDARLDDLQTHLRRERRTLPVLGAEAATAPCCDAVEAIGHGGEHACAACEPPASTRT